MAFYLYRELCQYLLRLARRCVNSKSLPTEVDFTCTLDFSIAGDKALTLTEFLSRKKFGPSFDQACKVRAELEKHEIKNKVTTEDIVVGRLKTELARRALSYLVFLFSKTQGRLWPQQLAGQSPRTGHIIFCPAIRQLSPEMLVQLKYLDEYVSFVDDLRQPYTGADESSYTVHSWYNELPHDATVPAGLTISLLIVPPHLFLYWRALSTSSYNGNLTF